MHMVCCLVYTYLPYVTFKSVKFSALTLKKCRCSHVVVSHYCGNNKAQFVTYANTLDTFCHICKPYKHILIEKKNTSASSALISVIIFGFT